MGEHQLSYVRSQQALVTAEPTVDNVIPVPADYDSADYDYDDPCPESIIGLCLEFFLQTPYKQC